MIKTKLSYLELVHQPLSNQEAVWAPNDQELTAILKRSHFYMIGGRMAGKFTDYAEDGDYYRFNFSIGDGPKQPVELNLRKLPGFKSYYFKKDLMTIGATFENWTDQLVIEEGTKGEWISFWSGVPKQSIQYEWFTPDRLLWCKSRNYPGIIGLNNHRELSTFDLLYVGIAKEQDSFDRLIKKGHHARQRILSNEPQRFPGARVTDEIFLFLFTVNPVIAKVWNERESVTSADLGGNVDMKAIIADAEKAFVSLLRPEYNTQQYPKYPEGKDGLFGSDYDRYGYVICENITFNTARGKFQGAYAPTSDSSNEADIIFVEGKKAIIHRAGASDEMDSKSAEVKSQMTHNPSPHTVKIFAYGSSLDLSQMRIRCPSVQVLSKASLPNHELIFPRTSSKAGRRLSNGNPGGVASIRRTGNVTDVVEGVIYQLTGTTDENSLDIAEGINSGSYVKKTIGVILENGERQTCLTYVANPMPGGPFQPSRQYLDQIIQGAQVHDLSLEYRARLATIATAD